MKGYPIRVAPESYRGNDARKIAKRAEYNRVAARIERHINAELERAPDNSVKQFFSASMAIDLGEDSKLVHRIVLSIDCGHNGVTCYKGDYKLAVNG